jgi:hypothetical protein
MSCAIKDDNLIRLSQNQFFTQRHRLFHALKGEIRLMDSPHDSLSNVYKYNLHK